MVKSSRRDRDRSKSNERDQTTTQQEADLAAQSMASSDINILQSQQSTNTAFDEHQIPTLTQTQQLEQKEMKSVMRRRSKSPDRLFSAEHHKATMVELIAMPEAGVPRKKAKRPSKQEQQASRRNSGKEENNFR